MPEDARPALPTMMGHMNLDPAGIGIFASLLHVLFAHVGNPVKVGDAAHHKNAAEYIRDHMQRGVSVSRLNADAAGAEYVIEHPRRVSPMRFRVRLGRPWHLAVEKYLDSSDTYVPIDLSTFAIRGPG